MHTNSMGEGSGGKAGIEVVIAARNTSYRILSANAIGIAANGWIGNIAREYRKMVGGRSAKQPGIAAKDG